MRITIELSLNVLNNLKNGITSFQDLRKREKLSCYFFTIPKCYFMTVPKRDTPVWCIIYDDLHYKQEVGISANPSAIQKQKKILTGTASRAIIYAQMNLM